MKKDEKENLKPVVVEGIPLTSKKVNLLSWLFLQKMLDLLSWLLLQKMWNIFVSKSFLKQKMQTKNANKKKIFETKNVSHFLSSQTFFEVKATTTSQAFFVRLRKPCIYSFSDVYIPFLKGHKKCVFLNSMCPFLKRYKQKLFRRKTGVPSCPYGTG